ncbi:MAG: hypothetical protein QM762_27975 [Chryseolinea sp.]
MHQVTRIILSLLLATATVLPAVSQIKATRTTVPLEFADPAPINLGWRRFLPGLKPDADHVFKPTTTYMALPVTTTALLGEFYWMGSTTRQSYNDGKIGRTYYWDLQGNLRGSMLFIDIAGKGKRGIKLAFARHRALF